MLLPSLGPQQRSPGCQKDRMLSPPPGPGSAGCSSPATQPLQAVSGGDTVHEGKSIFPPSLPSGGGGHSPGWAHIGRRHHSPDGEPTSTYLDLPCRWGRSHPWPVSRSSPIYPGSQVPMVAPLSCGDDHHPRQTLVPGPGMHSTHNLSEIDFPGLRTLTFPVGNGLREFLPFKCSILHSYLNIKNLTFSFIILSVWIKVILICSD